MEGGKWQQIAIGNLLSRTNQKASFNLPSVKLLYYVADPKLFGAWKIAFIVV